MTFIESFLADLLVKVMTSTFMIHAVVFLVAYMYTFWSLWVSGNIAYTRRHRLFYQPILGLCGIVGIVVDVGFNLTAGWLLGPPYGQTTLSEHLTAIFKKYSPIFGIPPNHWYQKLQLWVALLIGRKLVECWARGHLQMEACGYPPAKDLLNAFLKRYPTGPQQVAWMLIILTTGALSARIAWSML